MKSLEIIDDLLFDFLDDAIDESATFISKGEIEQIKVDLEVLEIFKALIFHNIKYVGFKSSLKSYEALFNIGTITKEQLDKLKQWLEENE